MMLAEQQDKKARPMRVALVLSAASMLVMACTGDLTDLEEYRDATLAKKSSPIEPLPQIRPYETFAYAASDLRAPFDPDAGSLNLPGVGPGQGISPDPNRKREYLEDFPLDSMRMVGTLNMRGELLGLVQDPEGLLHQVRKGDYAGQNHGRIIALTDSEIKLVEIISDGLGGWIERPAAIALSE